MLGESFSKELKPYSRIKSSLIDECSGLVKSPSYANTYWTHNDSGDLARIFAIDENGKLIKSLFEIPAYKGISILDAHNIDWEDIAVDSKGNLILGAFGNNNNARKDLAIYVVPEPNPKQIDQTRSYHKINFNYPDQNHYPPELDRNFDAEALFSFRDHLYILTKNRGNKKTGLYKFEELNPSQLNPLKKLEEFNIQGFVTAADYNKEKEILAVLTYKAIWIFKFNKDTKEPLLSKAKAYKLETKDAKQCEGICFKSSNELIISNEQQELFLVPVEEILVEKNFYPTR